MQSLAELSLSIAESQKGVHEQPYGSNSGPEINQYLKSVGLPPGNPWCMAFVYWCVAKAAAQLGLPNPLVKTGSVMTQWDQTKLRRLNIRDSAIKPGDIMIMRFPNGKGHCGFNKSINKGIIHTIEGNTNDDGSREGYEWAYRDRSITSIYGFIQLP